jgi:hypothetical protein
MRICHVITNGMVDTAGESRAEAGCVMTAHRHDDGTITKSPPEIAGLAVMARVRARLLHPLERWHIERMTMDYLFHFAAPARAGT